MYAGQVQYSPCAAVCFCSAWRARLQNDAAVPVRYTDYRQRRLCDGRFGDRCDGRCRRIVHLLRLNDVALMHITTCAYPNAYRACRALESGASTNNPAQVTHD